MQLREHPRMSFGGRRNWPPVWLRIGVEPRDWHVLLGEIGVLKTVRCNANRPGRIYLIITHQGAEYIGCLLFEDKDFCEEVAEHLQRCCNMPLEVIGTCDLISSVELH
jgi:hypothetical protein